MCTTEAEACRKISTLRRSSAVRSPAISGGNAAGGGAGSLLPLANPFVGPAAGEADREERHRDAERLKRITSREVSDRAGQQDDERPRSHPHLWSATRVDSTTRRRGDASTPLLYPHVKTQIEIVDAEPVQRSLDDGTGRNKGRNRDPDDPLGGDHALLPAGPARKKPHVTGATAICAAMKAGHADRHRHPPNSLLRRQDHLDGQSLGSPRLRNSQPREVPETRSTSASKDGRTA